MPTLDSQAAAAAKKAAASGGFAPIDPGTYLARLTSVIAKPASTGNPMWTWEFEILDEPYVGRKMWHNTVLVENSMWKLGLTFAAFGTDTNTNTDELIGEHARLEVSKKPITSGAKAGQMGNNIENLLPAHENSENVSQIASSESGESPVAVGEADKPEW